MDLWGWLAILRRHLAALVLCVFAGTIGGLYFSYDTAKTYEATARVIVNVPPAEQLSQALAGAQLTASFVQTYAQVATSRRVAELAAQNLGSGMTAGAVSGKLSATVEQNTYLIDVRAQDSKPAQAQAIANAVADALTPAVDELQQGRRATERISVQVLDHATLPGAPISPKPAVDIGLGVALGLVAGLLLVALLEALDRTIRSPQQARAAVNAPLLAVVPRHQRHHGVLVSRDPHAPMTEAYRSLRTALRFPDTGDPARTILVAGCVNRDGGTSVAVNLAVAFSLSGERVLLVDADLRRSGLASTLGLAAGGGLASVLTEGATLTDAVRPWGSVDVLPAGGVSGIASELVGSPQMAALVSQAADAYDIVIVDAPAVLPASDAAVLAATVDGVVLVVRSDATPEQAAKDAAARITAVGARLLGYVVNAARVGDVLGFDDRGAAAGTLPSDVPPPRPASHVH